MLGLFKKDVIVKCYTPEELGRLLDWMRDQYGISALNMNRFAVTAAMGSQLGAHPTTVLYFEVRVPYSMYATLREKFLKEAAFDEATLQREVFKTVTQS